MKHSRKWWNSDLLSKAQIPELLLERKPRRHVELVSESSQIYFPLNMVALCVDVQTVNQIVIYLRNSTPWFSLYLIRFDGSSWKEHKEDQLVWTLHEGENILEVKTLNILNRDGIPSRLKVISRLP